MSQENIPDENTESIPIAATEFEASEQVITMTQSFAVRQPDSDKKEFLVSVRASTLSKCRDRLEKIKSRSFPLEEILLALATLMTGASIGALSSGIKLDSLLGVIFYVFLPPIAVASFVAYLLNRKNSIQHASDIAREVLSDLPDPDKAV